MKPFTIVAIGLCAFLLLLGAGGFWYLACLGEAAIRQSRQPQIIDIKLPMKK